MTFFSFPGTHSQDGFVIEMSIHHAGHSDLVGWNKRPCTSSADPSIHQSKILVRVCIIAFVDRMLYIQGKSHRLQY